MCPMTGCATHNVRIASRGRSLTCHRLVLDHHLGLGMELVGKRLVDDIESKRLVAGRLHHEFESRGDEDGNILLQLCRIAIGLDASLASEYVINLLLPLELRGCRPRARSQPAISKKVGGVQDRALLWRSEIIAAGK